MPETRVEGAAQAILAQHWYTYAPRKEWLVDLLTYMEQEAKREGVRTAADAINDKLKSWLIIADEIADAIKPLLK